MKKREINLQVYSNGVKLYFKILIYANWSIAPLSIKSLLKGELSKTSSKPHLNTFEILKYEPKTKRNPKTTI